MCVCVCVCVCVYARSCTILAKRLSPKMESLTRVRILNEAVCVFLRANALEKDMNLFLPYQLYVNSRTD